MSDLIETKFGFVWGPFVVERVASHPKFGYVVQVRTASGAVEITTSPKGRKVRVVERALYDHEKAQS